MCCFVPMEGVLHQLSPTTTNAKVCDRERDTRTSANEEGLPTERNRPRWKEKKRRPSPPRLFCIFSSASCFASENSGTFCLFDLIWFDWLLDCLIVCVCARPVERKNERNTTTERKHMSRTEHHMSEHRHSYVFQVLCVDWLLIVDLATFFSWQTKAQSYSLESESSTL